MGAVLAGWLLLAGGEHFAVSALGGVAAGGTVYGLVLLALGVHEVHQVIGLVQKRVFKR